MANNYADEEQKQEEQQIDQMIAQAVEAVAKGENPDHLLEFMLLSVSGPAKDRLRKKFAAALKKRHLHEPKGEADIPSRGALARISNLLAVTAKQAFDRVVALVKSRPDIAAAVKEAGKVLAMNGVSVDKIKIAEAELGSIAPSSGKAQQGQAQQGGGRT